VSQNRSVCVLRSGCLRRWRALPTVREQILSEGRLVLALHVRTRHVSVSAPSLTLTLTCLPSLRAHTLQTTDRLGQKPPPHPRFGFGRQAVSAHFRAWYGRTAAIRSRQEASIQEMLHLRCRRALNSWRRVARARKLTRARGARCAATVRRRRLKCGVDGWLQASVRKTAASCLQLSELSTSLSRACLVKSSFFTWHMENLKQGPCVRVFCRPGDSADPNCIGARDDGACALFLAWRGAMCRGARAG
jgi:hypothetical protein